MCFTPPLLMTAVASTFRGVSGVRLPAFGATVMLDRPSSRRDDSFHLLREDFFLSVFSGMVAVEHHHYVLGVVVERITVFVMGYLSFLQQASQRLLCNMTVFVDPSFPPDSYFDFPILNRSGIVQASGADGHMIKFSFCGGLTDLLSLFFGPVAFRRLPFPRSILGLQRLSLTLYTFGRPLVSRLKRGKSSVARHRFSPSSVAYAI
jgi:hypothetical protein